MLYVRGNQLIMMTGPTRQPRLVYDDIATYFRKAEHCEPLANGNDDFDDNLHGVGGHLNVAEVRTRFGSG